MSIHHHHGHGHHHHHHDHTEGQKNLLMAFGLNFFFAIVEVIGGYLTNSMAVMSDALHDFGDSMALLSAYVLEKVSVKKADEKYTFGYRRYSILAALINGLILFLGSLFMIKEAISRLMAPETIHPEGVIWLAVLGIAVNGFAAFRLSKSEGMNQKMVMWHLLEDLLGWVAVLIVSIILLFKPWFILDSILSICISIIVLRGVWGSLKQSLSIFLQKFPANLDKDALKSELEAIENVTEVHEIKAFSIDDRYHQLTLHVVVPNEMTMQGLEVIKEKFAIILEKHKVLEYSLEFEGNEFSCHT